MAMLKLYSLSLLLVLIVVIQVQESGGCLEKERLALLQLKAFFLQPYHTNTSFDPLPFWVGKDCCVWNRVQCSNFSTGHVMELSLDYLLPGDLPFLNQNYLFNASLLQPFQHLVTLNLSYNNFLGFTQDKGLSNLKKLEILDLNHNRFSNSILSSISGLWSLKKLFLRDNNLRGSLPTRDIAKLRNLEALDLYKNGYFDGVIPLQVLRNLRTLSLSGNAFNGTIPIQGLCEANNLFALDISGNHITGQFPPCLTNLTGLRLLDISYNQFGGTIPSTIANLTSLFYLWLVKNNFEGSFSFSTLANLKNLKIFGLSGGNASKLQVETENPRWFPSFQLEELTLLNCNLNRQSLSNIPSFLLSQYELKSIDLAHNQLVGSFPHWLLQNNSELLYVYLDDNLLSGTLRLPTFKQELYFLQLSSNSFSGQLPNNIGSILSEVFYFNISRNSFEGNLPLSMKEMKNLKMLDLSKNNFSGNLQISMFSDLSYLACLLLESNNFSGSIKDGLTNTTSLVALDISKNMISGEIPIWIGSLQNLQYLQISENHFEGEPPVEIFSLQNLVFLDVSKNQLFGRVPHYFNLSSLSYLYMQENRLFGLIPHALSRSSKLKVLDLSHNAFSGQIPNWFNSLPTLRVLLLKRNRLQGPIPQQLCQAREINILDLSSNKLSGSIPSCLSDMSFGMVNDTNKYSTIQKGEGYLSIIIATYLTFFDPSEDYTSPQGQTKVDFTTKNRSDTYEGNVLNYMSGLDLSHNELTGDIPLQIGDMLQIRALNFSHNKLLGSIPKTISNLKQLESLDLSYNLLSGKIPSLLGELNSLAIFNVSYNNLSGMIPTSPQFQTYPASSFFGNSYLCGQFIEKKCSDTMVPPDREFIKGEEDQTFTHLEAFCWSFSASYVVTLLGLIAVLYINSQWREAWFYYVHVCSSYVCKCLIT